MMRLIKTTGWLAMAAAIIFGTAACSSSDDSIAEQQPINPTEPQVYTMTVQASKSTDEASTRGLSLDGQTLNVKWNEGEVVYVTDEDNNVLGTLTAAANNSATTTLSGEIKFSSKPADLKFFLHNYIFDYRGQKGVLLKPASGTDNSIETNYDYAWIDGVGNANVTFDDVNKTVSVSVDLNFTSYQSIVKFTLVDRNDNAINPTSLTLSSSGSIWFTSINFLNNSESTFGDYVLTGLSGTTNEIYVSIGTNNGGDLTLTATTASGDTYTYTKTNGMNGITLGKYYAIKVKMNPPVVLNIDNPAVGQVIGSDGKNYVNVNSLPSGVTAVAKICYVSGGNGLALAISDEGDMNWNEAKTAAAAHTPAFTGGTWKLATKDEWDNMISGAGSYSDLMDNAVLFSRQYWSSTESDSEKAWAYNFNYSSPIVDGGWNTSSKSISSPCVRACLAFTYTPPVTGHALSESVVGEIIGTDGLAYAAADKDNLPSGVTAVAKIAYVGDAGSADASSETYKGLALALDKANSGNALVWCNQNSATCLATQYTSANAAKGDMAGIANTDALVAHLEHQHPAAVAAKGYKYAESADAGAHPEGTSGWFLPSVGQWDKMATAVGGYDKLKSNYLSYNTSQIWSSTEYTAAAAWRFVYNNVSGNSWYEDAKTDDENVRVRACLAF